MRRAALLVTTIAVCAIGLPATAGAADAPGGVDPASSAGAPAAEGAPVAPTASAARAARIVVSPSPGQTVRSHVVRVRVRAGRAATLRARLNGSAIGADFGPARRGVRRLQVSISHGLRRGANVLAIAVRRPAGTTRRTTVRFTVSTRRPLVGAGRNRTVATGGTVALSGRLAARGDRPSARWELVRAPRRAPLHRVTRTPRRGARAPSARAAANQPFAGLSDPVTGLPVSVAPATVPASGDGPALGPIVAPQPPAAVVASPASLSATFQPTVPGSYTLRLTAGTGAQATSDLVTIDATPRNKLVPIWTMTAWDDNNGDQRGIRVGNATFLLRDAVGRTSQAGIQNDPSRSFLQALVLDRRTTAFVSNRKYANVEALGADLAALDSTKLVVLVLQPSSQVTDFGPLMKYVEQIGVPEYPLLPKAGGTISAIGVPGMAPGQADVNIQSYDLSPMQGYLTPDTYSGFTFVPSGRVPFRYVPSPSDPCVNNDAGGRSCNGQVGFVVREQNSRTLVPGDRDRRFYATGTPGGQTGAEAARMAADLAAIPSENVVTIRAVSSVPQGATQYGAPVYNVDRATMGKLADAVAGVGGTRHAFNLAAATQMPAAASAASYTLVGWQGAGAGNGAEAMVGVDGTGPAANLSGVLRPDSRSRYRPAQVKPTDYGPDLTDVLFAPPTAVWPLDNDPGASRALSYLGTLDRRLGPDPRSAYWRQRFPDATTWDTLSSTVRAAQYSNVPPALRGQFTQADFAAAQRQLAQELTWVGNVRSYLAAAATPFNDNALRSWEDAELIADEIYSDAYKPEGDAVETWLSFTETLLNLAGPLTDDVTSVIADLMELGTWAFAGDAEGRPSGADLKIAADRVGGTLSSQMTDAARSYWSAGDVIVSDPAKLAAIGPEALCNPGPGCADQWSFTADQANQVSADLERSVERVAYEKLFPLGFHVFRLNPDRRPAVVRGQPRDPRTYKCSYYPWYYYSDVAIRYATAALLQEYDPQGPNNFWQILVLSRPPGTSTAHGQPPDDRTLNRMFGAVPSPAGPDGENARAGGLGISPTAFMGAVDEDDWDYWSPLSGNRPTWDDCDWVD